MPTDKELKHHFLSSLAAAFGAGFLELIQEPKGTLVGERVLYKYKNNQTAERRPMTGQEFQSLRFELEALAGQVGGTASLTSPDNSGLPHPRTVDLKESSMAMQIPAEKWLNSAELLPSTDFELEWMLGIIHWSDYKELLFIDFTHPQVKCMFCADYEDLYDQSIGENMTEQIETLLAKKNTLVGELHESSGWGKIASINGRLLTKTQST